MGLTEIRTAMKVDLEKEADQQSGLHVLPNDKCAAMQKFC